jgi:hypothetical protein
MGALTIWTFCDRKAGDEDAIETAMSIIGGGAVAADRLKKGNFIEQIA